MHPGHPQLQRQNSWDPPVPPAHPHHPESSLGPPAADSNGAPQGPPELTEAEQKAQEDALVDRASELKKQRAILSQAFDRPNPEPIRCLDQQAAMLKEMRFMFLDFSQVGGFVQLSIMMQLPLGGSTLSTCLVLLQDIRQAPGQRWHAACVLLSCDIWQTL